MDSVATWEKVLEEIKPHVSSPTFFTLFKKTSLVNMDDTSITIGAPSTILIDMLQKKFKSTIEDAVLKITQRNLSLVFTAKASAVHQSTNEKETPLFSTPIERPKMPVGHLPRVRADFTFETLAVSDSNNLAFESAKYVAKNPGVSYNPLFIYGPVGVGKTHLMQAIANEVYSQNPDNKILYITSEEFTNEVVEAIRTNDTARMKRKFRSANLLIIDDVQFIAGKDRVQEELFHTFNSLIDNGAQIALSSDRPPSEIKKLEARLSSRFAGGLTVDIQPPDFELRTAIVLKKGEKFNVALSIDVAKIIAEKAQDVRSLEGALLRVITEATTKNADITEELAVRVLGANGDNKVHHMLHAEDVIDTVCQYYQVKPTQLKGPKRDASLVKPRQIAMFLLKTELKLTHVEIGNILGGRDHTTVMHGVEKIEKLVDNTHDLAEEIAGINKILRG